jgi:hypothetical protein
MTLPGIDQCCARIDGDGHAERLSDLFARGAMFDGRIGMDADALRTCCSSSSSWRWQDTGAWRESLSNLLPRPRRRVSPSHCARPPLQKHRVGQF